MNEFDPERPRDADKRLSRPSSIGHSSNEKREEISVQVVKGEESLRASILDPYDSFPDGGARAWSAIAGAFILQFTGFGYINSFGVYQDFYVREYLTGSTPSEIGWIGGVQVFLNFSLGAVTGRLFDRGYFYHLIISGIIIHAISVFTLSLSQKNVYYQVFLTNGLGIGLASGLTYTPSLAIPGHYFRKRRSLAVGIVSSGSALGAVIHPIMLNRLINGHVGFHKAVKISGSLNVFLLIVAGCLMRTRLPRKEKQRFPVIQWLKEPGYLAFFLSAIPCFLGLFFPVFYLQLNAITHGVDRKFAFYALSILNASSFFGRTVPTAIAHKFGAYNLGTGFTIATGLVVLSMIAVKDLAGTVSFAVIFGLFSGASIALTPAMLATYLAKDINEFGTRLGLYCGLGGILGLFATPISGALLTSQYRWIDPILLSGISMIMTGVLYGISRHFVFKREGSHII